MSPDCQYSVLFTVIIALMNRIRVYRTPPAFSCHETSGIPVKFVTGRHLSYRLLPTPIRRMICGSPLRLGPPRRTPVDGRRTRTCWPRRHDNPLPWLRRPHRLRLGPARGRVRRLPPEHPAGSSPGDEDLFYRTLPLRVKLPAHWMGPFRLLSSRRLRRSGWPSRPGLAVPATWRAVNEFNVEPAPLPESAVHRPWAATVTRTSHFPILGAEGLSKHEVAAILRFWRSILHAVQLRWAGSGASEET